MSADKDRPWPLGKEFPRVVYQAPPSTYESQFQIALQEGIRALAEEIRELQGRLAKTEDRLRDAEIRSQDQEKRADILSGRISALVVRVTEMEKPKP